MSAMTLTSAELFRAMEPSRVLFPTPLPPKMPMRCPFPQGSKPSMARIPVMSGSVMCARLKRILWRLVKAVALVRIDGGTLIHRHAEAIQNAPEQMRPDVHRGVAGAREHAVAEAQAVRIFERHGEHVAVAEADHLGADGAAAFGADHAEVADSSGGASRFDQQADQLHHLARALKRIEALDIGEVSGIRSMAVSWRSHLVIHPVRQAALDFFELRVDGGVQFAAIGFKQ